MLDVIFKYVGQGDSIIIHWNSDDGLKKTGIIDCNKFNNSIPTLDYIINQNIKEIEFVVLSHPHHDHFSGFYDFFEYCDNNGVLINCFYHTKHSHPDYLKQACKSVTAATDLYKLIEKIQNLFDSKKINKRPLDDFSQELILNKDLKLQCLSPSEREKDDFITTKNYIYDLEEETGNNLRSNILSTVFKLYSKDWYVLLTADCTNQTIRRISKNKNYFEEKLVLGQIPHHGSQYNFVRAFWNHKNREKGTYAAISVGENKYKHPSQYVIDKLIDLEYRPRFTADISQLKAINNKEDAKSTNLTLGIFSKPIIEGKDLHFQISSIGNIALI